MSDFDMKRLPDTRDAIAPDGSDVRILLGLKGGGWLTLSSLLAKRRLRSPIERSKKSGSF